LFSDIAFPVRPAAEKWGCRQNVPEMCGGVSTLRECGANGPNASIFSLWRRNVGLRFAQPNLRLCSAQPALSLL
jgi:hypothetical protein